MEHPRHVVVVSALVRNDGDALLLIRHPRRGWEMPQGRVEEGEGLTEALHREVREETGVEIEPLALAAVYSKISPPPAVIFTFLARYGGGALQTGAETLEIGWFAPEEALRRVKHPVNRDRLRTALDFDESVLYRSYATDPFRILSENRIR